MDSLESKKKSNFFWILKSLLYWHQLYQRYEWSTYEDCFLLLCHDQLSQYSLLPYLPSNMQQVLLCHQHLLRALLIFVTAINLHIWFQGGSFILSISLLLLLWGILQWDSSQMDPFSQLEVLLLFHFLVCWVS